MGNGLTPCTCKTVTKRGKNLYSITTRTPNPGCPIHVAKKASA